MNGYSETGRKASKLPSLDYYDNIPPCRGNVIDASRSIDNFLKEYPRTHGRDKALLVALGVDGDVPLMQARMNAGLPLEAANDNDKISAAIAA